MTKNILYNTLILYILAAFAIAQDKSTFGNYTNRSDGCTSVTVGKKASFDGSVMTSHTMDGHRDRVCINIVPATG